MIVARETFIWTVLGVNDGREERVLLDDVFESNHALVIQNLVNLTRTSYTSFTWLIGTIRL